MLKISLRNIASHPGRYLSTMIAIVLGVSFFIGTGVLTATVERSLNNAIGEAFTDVDAVVRSADSIEFSGFEIRAKIPADLADQIATVDGVESVAPSMRGYAQIVGKDGKVLGGQAYGTNWIDGGGNPYRLDAGKAPSGPNEIIIDTNSLEDSGYKIGDKVRVLPLPADQPFTIVGTASYKTESDFSSGENLVAFDFDTAAEVFGSTDVEMIVAEAADGVTPEQLAKNINAAGIKDGSTKVEAITGKAMGEEFQDLIGMFTSIISTALQVFAFISLAVGIFIIYNTFTILVAQRTREMALLRAIGSTGRQVRRAVIVESIIVGLIASAIGSVVGIGLGWAVLKVLGGIGLEISGALVVPPGTIIAGMIIGTLITLGAAYLPARSASKVPPIAALRVVSSGEAPVGRFRGIFGIALAVLAVVSVGLSLAGVGTSWLVIAALSIIVGLLVLGPILVKPLSTAIGTPFAALRGMIGGLAQQNAARSPKRTANTTAALMIGVLLVSAASVFAASLRKSIDSQLGEQIVADEVVRVDSSAVQVGGGLPTSVATDIAAIPGVKALSPLRNSMAEINGSFANINGIYPAQAAATIDAQIIEGSLADLDASSIATSNGKYKIGDQVPVKFLQGTTTLTVKAIYDDNADQLVGPWVVSTEVLDANVSQSLDSLLLIATDGSTATANAIKAAVADNPIATVETRQEYVDYVTGDVAILLNLLYGLLGVSVLVAVVGIVNTMSLSILERTREIGLLRAVGMTRRQIRSSIRYEASIVAIMGTVLGLVVGSFFAWLGVQATGDALPQFAMPWGSLLIIGLLGVLCGIVAGVLPARRAAKMNVLDAIASE